MQRHLGLKERHPGKELLSKNVRFEQDRQIRDYKNVACWQNRLKHQDSKHYAKHIRTTPSPEIDHSVITIACIKQHGRHLTFGRKGV
jgi:hypothetical protein